MSPTGARQDLQTIQQSVAAGSVVVASTGTGPFEQRHSADLFGARQRWRLGLSASSGRSRETVWSMAASSCVKEPT